MSEKNDYLLCIYNDARQEIKQRIAQRDSFGIQLIVAFSALLVAGFAYSPIAFLFLPVVGWFYNLQIEYSYHIHNRLTAFLRGRLAEEMVSSAGFSETDIKDLYWERNCEKYWTKGKTNERRDIFFIIFSLVMPVVAEILFFFISNYKTWIRILIMSICFAIYLFLALTLMQRRKALNKRLEEGKRKS